MTAEPHFLVEDWQHARSAISNGGSTRVFFVIKVSGTRGRWALKAYIMGPGVEDEGACTPVEEEVDLEFVDDVFVELECEVEDPVPGTHTMRMYVGGVLVGNFPFEIRAS